LRDLKISTAQSLCTFQEDFADMDRRKELEELKANPNKVRFKRLCQIAESFGFESRKGRGSHRVFFRDGIFELLNFQNEDGWAKAYQVRQFIKVIEKYNLQED
jgi:hypothetical protein